MKGDYAKAWKQRKLQRLVVAMDRTLDAMSCPWCYHGNISCDCHRGRRFDVLVAEHARLKELES